LNPGNIVITDLGVLKLDNFSMCLYENEEKKEVPIDDGLADLRYTAPELLVIFFFLFFLLLMGR
jgi:serine/threonine protein kinase